jgi:hypothetical protein
MSRVECFRDILIPSHYHTGPMEKDTMSWDEKLEALVWRGSSTGMREWTDCVLCFGLFCCGLLIVSFVL